MAFAVSPAGPVRTAAELQTVLDASRAGFELEQVPAAAAHEWCEIDGALQHRSGGFFSVTGVATAQGERLLLHQPQAAVTGLLSARIDGERCFLLQARAEPGCIGEAQFGPTVQSTPANYMRLHGGAATPLVEAFLRYAPDATLVDDTTQLDLGERYVGKSKRCLLVDVPAPPLPPPGFVWARPQALREAIGRSAFLNIDLRSILAIAEWADDARELAPASAAVRSSAATRVRADALGDVVSALQVPRAPRPGFVPLDALSNWRRTPMGWQEREPCQGFGIDFFAVKTAYREVRRWIQPLVNSPGDGHVALARRDRGGVAEFFVRPVVECGLATGAALAPSYVRYPGTAGEPPAWLVEGERLSRTTESDEGGRFFRDVSVYEVVDTDEAFAGEPGAWLRLSELKLLLRMSNVCTIQLRGVLSQLLASP